MVTMIVHIFRRARLLNSTSLLLASPISPLGLTADERGKSGEGKSDMDVEELEAETGTVIGYGAINTVEWFINAV